MSNTNNPNIFSLEYISIFIPLTQTETALLITESNDLKNELGLPDLIAHFESKKVNSQIINKLKNYDSTLSVF